MTDLRDLVTVFVIYSGEPDLAACLEALEQQNSRFRLCIIEWVAPMDAAFQMMLDNCRTPMFVQVDADMVLQPGAVLTMTMDLQAQAENVSMVCWPLYDHHLGVNILGVKAYRHAAMAQYPYQGAYSCEVVQLSRMEADGWKWESRWPRTLEHFEEGFHDRDAAVVMGVHSPTWSPERIWTRYRRLGQKWQRSRYDWLEDVPRRLWERIAVPRDDHDLWALLALVLGMSEELSDEDGEQDWRARDRAFRALEAMLCRPML